MGNPNMMPPVGRGGLMPHDGRMSSGSQVPGQLGSSGQLPYPQGRYADAVSVRVVFAAICDAISAATAGSAGAIFLPSGCIHAIDAEVCSGPATSSLAAAVGGFRAIAAFATIVDIAAPATHATVALVAASSTASPAAKRTV